MPGANDVHMVQLMPLSPITASLKSRMVYLLMPACPGCPIKRPSNGCSICYRSVCSKKSVVVLFQTLASVTCSSLVCYWAPTVVVLHMRHRNCSRDRNMTAPKLTSGYSVLADIVYLLALCSCYISVKQTSLTLYCWSYWVHETNKC